MSQLLDWYLDKPSQTFPLSCYSTYRISSNYGREHQSRQTQARTLTRQPLLPVELVPIPGINHILSLSISFAHTPPHLPIVPQTKLLVCCCCRPTSPLWVTCHSLLSLFNDVLLLSWNWKYLEYTAGLGFIPVSPEPSRALDKCFLLKIGPWIFTGRILSLIWVKWSIKQDHNSKAGKWSVKDQISLYFLHVQTNTPTNFS